MKDVLVVGSVAYDTITTPWGRVERTLGGSANYFSMAAAHTTQVKLVGVIGEDYEPDHLDLLRRRHVDLSGLQVRPGKTFHWSGRYEGEMNEAITLETHLNVFQNFDPIIPESYRQTPFVFLANIDPDLQRRVLLQIEKPLLVGMDTMNFWINAKLDSLKDLIKRIDVLLLNEGEARQLAGTMNTIRAAAQLAALGPRAVVIKRGEYGFVLFCEEQFFILPAFPIHEVIDPTGAGDTFAGGFFGSLAKENEVGLREIKRACVNGVVLASFTVEDFGTKALERVTWPEVEARHKTYRQIVSYLD